MRYARDKYGTTSLLVISPTNICSKLFSDGKKQCLRGPSTLPCIALDDAFHLDIRCD